MTTRISGILVGMLGVLLGTAAASGQPTSDVSDRVHPRASLAGETYVGPHVGYSFIGEKDRFCRCDIDTNDFLLFGGRVGHFFTDQLAIEGTAQYLRLDRVPSYWELTLGALWDFTPSIPGWNTYVGVGGGASRHLVFRGSGFAIAYLAAGSEYRFSKLVGMRLEIKGNYNFSHDASERFGTFGTFNVHHHGSVDIQPNVGVLFHFGGAPPPVVVEPAPAPAPPPPPAPPPAPPTTPVAPAPPPVVTPPPPAPRAPTTDTIDFDRGRSRLTNIAKAKLDAVALRLRENPRATVEITGFPDTAGSRGEALARQRAENAKQYLIDRHGIDASRITTRANTSDSAHFGQDVIVVTFQSP